MSRGKTPCGSRGPRSETSSMRRLEGSRWRLRRARGIRQTMEFECALFRFLLRVSRERRCRPCSRQGSQIPAHMRRIISRAASAAPAASLLSATRKLSRFPRGCTSSLARRLDASSVIIASFQRRTGARYRHRGIRFQFIRRRPSRP
jgi:hypothetical protein